MDKPSLSQPLKLAVSPQGWRLFAIRKTDSSFQKFAEKIFLRDNYTCQYCHFQAKQHQEVVNRDQNYHHNKADNLVTACCFCTQCFFLEAVGKNEYGGGTLIYLPELSQSELNSLCHVLFCAMANANAYQTDAQNIYRSFTLRAKIIDKNLGEGMSNPTQLGQMLIEVPMENRNQTINEVVKNIRLLPARDKFTTQISDWAKAAFEELENC